MKKLTSLILAFILCLSTTVCFAHEIKDAFTGTTFYISNKWVELEDSESYYFYHRTNDGEKILIDIMILNENKGDDVEFYETELKELCETYLSDSELASELSLNNHGADVTVTTDSIVDGYEYYNGVKYYRYEKAYTAVAPGFYDTAYYHTVFFTTKDGMLYLIEYGHDYSSGNFADVVEMFNTVTYGKVIDIYVNETEVIPDSFPVIANDRTLVPIRAIVEELGYSVTWIEEERSVLIENEEIMLEIFIDGYTMQKIDKTTDEKEEIKLDVPAIILLDRTYLPLRAVGEALNCDVNWDGATRTININSK